MNKRKSVSFTNRPLLSDEDKEIFSRTLFIEYEFKKESFQEIDDRLLTVVGFYSESSGAGFGVRDHLWECYSVDTANSIAARILDLKDIPGLRVKVGIEGEWKP